MVGPGFGRGSEPCCGVRVWQASRGAPPAHLMEERDYIAVELLKPL